MAIIKKCSLCENKGLLLKLNNNLCTSCNEKLKKVENTYNNILQEISKDPKNKDTYIYNLFSIMGDIETLSGFSTIINKDLVLKLIHSLNLNENPKLINNSILTTESPIPTVDHVDNVSNISMLDNENTIIKPVNDITFISHTAEPETLSTESETVSESKLNEENIEPLKTKPIELNTDTDTDTNADTDIKPILTQSDKIVIETLYNNTAELMKKLDFPDIDNNELAKGFFALKNNFRPSLKNYNLLEVNDVNIDTYITLLEKKLCHRTNSSPEKLYSFFNYVVISIQTTGIKLDFSDIIEISALKVSYDDIIDEFYSLINPLKSIKLIIEERTGISSDMVAKEPSLDMVLPRLNEFLRGYSIVSFNSNYTLGFINHFNKQLFNIDALTNDECILKLYRSRYKGFYGYPPKFSDLTTITVDILSNNEANSVNDLHSIAKSSSLSIYKLYEILKYRYK